MRVYAKAADSRQQTADSKEQTVNSKQHTAGGLLIADCCLLFAVC